MISELYIEDLAVIKQAVIPFTGDFNVFTGETGAGKSILINGINAVLGRRASRDIVRSGCEKAVIGALFTGLSPAVKSKLDEFGIDCSNDEIHISREISVSGGSVARINSKTASVSAIKEIGGLLVDIHGQHDGSVLLRSDSHIEIIDSYADLAGKISEYKSVFKELQETARKLKKLAEDEEHKKERLIVLEDIISQIGELEIEDELEDSKLEEEYQRLKKSEELLYLLNTAGFLLSGDEDSTGLVGDIGDL